MLRVYRRIAVVGLSANEMVAASGSFKLRDGVLVAIAGEQGKGNHLTLSMSRR